MTIRQRDAQIRNWNKRRVASGYLNPSQQTTKEERRIIDKINKLRELLLEQWDVNSVQLNFKPRKPKCLVCKSVKDVKYVRSGVNNRHFVCKTHLLKTDTELKY